MNACENTKISDRPLLLARATMTYPAHSSCRSTVLDCVRARLGVFASTPKDLSGGTSVTVIHHEKEWTDDVRRTRISVEPLVCHPATFAMAFCGILPERLVNTGGC